MLYGLAGSHRTGKTTLMRRLAAKLDLHCHELSVTKLMADAGYNGVADLSPADRMTAQERLLDAALVVYDRLPRPCIVDRTPLDMIGYMAAEIGMHNTAPDIAERAEAYFARAIQATRERFDTVMVLRPLGVYEVDPTKPPPNLAYQWHVQFIIEGALCCAGFPIAAQIITATELDARMQDATQFIVGQMAELNESLANVSVH